MDVTQTRTAAAAQTGGTRAATSPLSSDFETFLKMLTVQMQNQDPLNPIESADYAVQLATFSGVEQSVRTNQLLESLHSQFGLLGMAELAGWVGQEAKVAAAAYMDGTAVTLALDPAAQADRAVLVVRNANGDVVAREPVPRTDGPYDWLGSSATGDALPTGHYTLSLESYRGDALLRTDPVQHYARILEAQTGTSGTSLVLRGGEKVAATAITALRVP